jgi:hypothetical protein
MLESAAAWNDVPSGSRIVMPRVPTSERNFMADPTTTPELYEYEEFEAKRQVLKLFGAAFYLRSMEGRLLGYSKQKAFKLKEDIRVFSDEDMTNELLFIQADRAIDFSAAYRVTDSKTGEVVGKLRRKGWSSLVRDSWEILDAEGKPQGRVIEDSGWKAMARRLIDFAAFLLPQTFLVQVGDQTVATMRQNRNFLAPKFTVDLGFDDQGLLPRPLAIATVVLLLAIEGRQA